MPSLNTKLASAPNTTANYVLKATTSTTIGNSLIFDNGTNVGIGTASPFAIADTNLSVNGTTSSAIQLGFNGTRYGQFYTDSGEIRLSAVANLPLTFYSNNLERMRITSGGELLINATTNGAPNLGYQLGVRGTNANSLISIALANQTLSTQGSYIGLDGTVGYIHMIDNKPWIFSTNNTERMRITSGGNVCIGTTTSSGYGNINLDLSAGAGTSAYFVIRTGSSSVIAEYALDGGAAYLSTKTAHPLIFRTSDVERMRIASGGNVSIGSATDSGFRLYVKGTNGLYIDGGTSSSNSAFLINDNTGGTQYLRVRGDGFLFSTPTYNNQWPGFSANMYIASDGSMGRITASSIRFKENINEWNGKGLETILALKPKTFTYKKEYCDKSDIVLLGLIAEEVAEISPYLAEYENPDRTGQVENVRYDIIVVPLIAAIQELNQKLQDQQQTINSLINR
jgi:hypothetical protein